MELKIRPGLPAIVAVTRQGAVELPGVVTWARDEAVEVELHDAASDLAGEPVFLIVGAPGSQHVAAAVWERSHENAVSLRISGPWRAVGERRSDRVAAAAPVTLTAGRQAMVATLTDLSREGLGVCSVEALPEGPLTVTFPVDGVPVLLPCLAVRVAERGGAYEYGLRFDPLTAAQRAALETLLAGRDAEAA